MNLLEPGDAVVIGVAGVFGERMSDVASRAGARVTQVRTEPGTALDDDAMAEAIASTRPRLVAFVHAETSTGVLQPVENIARAAREAGALVVLDCVTSLGGLPVTLDDWGIDAAYSGTQKCLSCPPGLSPVSFSERAVERARTRTTPVQSWYLDINLLAGYLGKERVYHHTAPISAILALAEALRMIDDEGMETRSRAPPPGGRGADRGPRTPGLRAARRRGHPAPQADRRCGCPPRCSSRARRSCAGACSTATASRWAAASASSPGSIWRIGLMGENARLTNVESLLCALRRELRSRIESLP